MVKEDVEDFYEFILAYCFTQAFHSHDICQEFVKELSGRIVSNSLFLRGSLVAIIGYENFLWLNLYVIRMSLSTVFVLLHLDLRTLVVEPCPFLWLIVWMDFKAWINTIQSKAKLQWRFKIQCIVCGHLWTLTTS